MNLAWKEITFYKFRFILIMLIIFLMATMVLFISGLAQGLARENISLFNQLNRSQYIVQKMKEPQIEKSILTDKQEQHLNKIVNERPIKMIQKNININGNEENVIALSGSVDSRLKLKAGTYPRHKNEIAINEKLMAEGLKKGDNVKFSKEGEHYKIVGILNDAMYAHSNIILMDQSLFDNKTNHIASFYALNHLTHNQVKKIKAIQGVQQVQEQDLTDHIASYKAEQSPLKMMVYSLYIITAIVLSAFFYVMTIQKVSEIGILKAIGISTSQLLFSLLLQISLISFIGVVFSEILMMIIKQVLPVSMPFYINIKDLFIVLFVFLFVGLVGATLSFIKLLKIDPIEAIGGNE